MEEPGRILIADDEPAFRETTAELLQLKGYQCTGVGSAAAALDLVRQSVFDLLLADIRMPVMDGIALALATARDYPAMTILLMTGYADQRERAHGLDALIHDVVSKPFTLPQIREAVNGALRQ